MVWREYYGEVVEGTIPESACIDRVTERLNYFAGHIDIACSREQPICPTTASRLFSSTPLRVSLMPALAWYRWKSYWGTIEYF
jgi:hypothetical protein